MYILHLRARAGKSLFPLWERSNSCKGSYRPVFIIYFFEHVSSMTPYEETIAWARDFEAHFKDCKDLAEVPVLTNVKSGARVADYIPVTREKNGYVIDWRALSRYCAEAGYIRKVSKDGEITIYRFDISSGYYQVVAPKILLLEIINGIKEVAPDMAIPVKIQGMIDVNVISCLRATTDLASTEERRNLASMYSDGEVIPFKNGIYSIRYNKLLPRTSYVFIEHPLNVDFNPSALDNPIRQRYMDVMCGDEQLFELLFEQLGYAMYARTFIVPTCTIFYGGGSNGKSNVLKVLSKIIGERNISSLTLNDMTNAFTVARSEGKLINITHDASPASANSNLTATSNIVEFIKKSTSGEPHTFNPKNGAVHEGYGPRKFIFATNALLNFGGMDGGLARRMYTIPFNATFKQDSAIEDSFYEKGAMEWFAMQALISMLCMIRRKMGDRMYSDAKLDGIYLRCDAADEMKSEQMAAQDTVLDWMSTDLELDIQDKEAVRDALIDKAELYRTYCRFCSDTGRQSKSMKQFHATLKAMFGIGQRRTMSGGEHVYISVRI